MSRTYARELRADSSDLIIPLTAFAAVIIALVGLTGWLPKGFAELWHLVAILIISPVSARLAWRLIKTGRQESGGAIFIGAHLLLLTFSLMQSWTPGSVIPYLFGVFVVISSMLIYPVAGFTTWLVSTLLIFAGGVLGGSLTLATFSQFFVPVLVNLLLAIASFLSAMEWQTAVESVSLLHRRAQDRRDELFAMKEEVTRANDRLTYLNRQLDLAWQAAVTERDLRTRFMNNVSHELRTPLNAVVNFAHILAEGGCGPVNERQIDYLDRIEESGWHLLGILNDLLDMAQIESGEFKLYLETADLRRICQEAVSNVQGLALAKENLELITDYPDRWPWAQVDRMRLKQALINLLGNAVKYTDEGYVALRVRADEQVVRIIVEDSGIGIDPQHHDIIFQEFRQIDETAARRRMGTGLGLPITRHLIERHGGAINVESALGQGSKFIITLPLSQPDAALAAGADGKSAQTTADSHSPPS
jgi:signal transduction histidine kinase